MKGGGFDKCQCRTESKKIFVNYCENGSLDIMELSVKLQNQIIEFLRSLPNLGDVKARQAFIFDAGLDPELKDQIPVDEPPAQFIPLLLSILRAYGQLNDERDALEAVLETAKNYIGQDKRKYCESLIRKVSDYRKKPPLRSHPEDFEYDVFLNHSVKDRDTVRNIAVRLRKDRLRVWFNEWEIQSGDDIPEKIEVGLEHSRVLVLCMSANAFGSEWPTLEANTFRFRDPQNPDRRFIPLRLDDAPINDSLVQFLYIDWLAEEREQEYEKLVEACRSLAKFRNDITKEPTKNANQFDDKSRIP